ncbi:twin-arginine translocase TatA/TatE family subunit [Candidatus Marinamargulisbacteria bacterium SCGC AAA071-K20]|nr:twin-arginine translocase TatA/TatE family subunit [Candidatus Marinamargulisbacteria bacterium SCGC AAA071-K20]
MFGSTELIVIGLIVFVLFGAAAIPKFAKSIGQAKGEFEKGLKDGKKKDSKEKLESKES